MNSNISQNPTVTVLMPVFNGSEYLLEAINSILHQTYRNFEFLIIDDCSTDNSLEIIRSLSDYRIRVVTNKKNLGLTKTLNKGLQLAMGGYIARIDQDDISLKCRLQRQVEFLQKNPDIKLIGTWFQIINSKKIIKTLRPPVQQKKLVNRINRYNPFAHSSVMFDLKAIHKLGGYPENIIHAQDFDLWVTVLMQYKASIIPEVLVQVRYHQNRSTNSPEKQVYINEESLIIYKKALQHPDLGLIMKCLGYLNLFIKPRRRIEYLKKISFIGFISRKLRGF